MTFTVFYLKTKYRVVSKSYIINDPNWGFYKFIQMFEVKIFMEQGDKILKSIIIQNSPN